MARFYVHPKDEEVIIHQDLLKEYMEYRGLTEIKAEIAEPMPFSTGIFYCRWAGACGDKSQAPCGKNCEGYTPRNGKSGICKHQRNAYESTGEFETIKL